MDRGNRSMNHGEGIFIAKTNDAMLLNTKPGEPNDNVYHVLS